MSTVHIDPNETAAEREAFLKEQHAKEKAEAERAHAQAVAGRVDHMGGGQVTYREGQEAEFRKIECQTFTAADLFQHAGTGYMATVQRASGGPIIGDLKGSDLIEVEHGLKVSLDQATAQGYLRKVGPGHWEDINAGKP